MESYDFDETSIENITFSQRLRLSIKLKSVILQLIELKL